MTDGIRVLYVDDEPDLLALGKIFLEQEGRFTVTTSTSASESLASPALLTYDVIVSDYLMPGDYRIEWRRSSSFDFIYFGMANAASRYFDQDLTRLRLRHHHIYEFKWSWVLI